MRSLLIQSRMTRKQKAAFRGAIDAIKRLEERRTQLSHDQVLDRLAAVTYESADYKTLAICTKAYIEGYAEAAICPFGYKWEKEMRPEYMIDGKWIESVPVGRWCDATLSRRVWIETGVVWCVYGDE